VVASPLDCGEGYNYSQFYGGECCPTPPATGCGDSERQNEYDCSTSGGFWKTAPDCFCDYPFQTDPGSPVLLDVNGDGFRLTDAARGVPFDLDGDAVRERLSWTAPGADDAWLALDRDGDGAVGNGRELFGNFTPQPVPPAGVERNGFLALAEFDRPARGGNADGSVDARDAVFTRLRLWRDANHDGISQPAELHALAALGVRRLHLDYKRSKRVDEHGNEFRYRAKLDDAKGGKADRWAWDVFLVRAP
jgi:hypothetical protein